MKFLSMIPVLCVIALTGCSNKMPDPYASYRNKTASDLFVSAQTALAKGDYSAAVTQYEAQDAVYPFGPYAPRVALNSIYAYYMADDMPSALTAADRFIRLYPRSPYADYAYYMRGVIGFTAGLNWLQRRFHVDASMRELGPLQQSYAAFASLNRLYPHSLYAPDARLRMVYIRNQLAARELSIARFYWKKKADVAASNRAIDVVMHYQGSTAVQPALILAYKAYQRLGLKECAAKTRALLMANFPNAHL